MAKPQLAAVVPPARGGPSPERLIVSVPGWAQVSLLRSSLVTGPLLTGSSQQATLTRLFSQEGLCLTVLLLHLELIQIQMSQLISENPPYIHTSYTNRCEHYSHVSPIKHDKKYNFFSLIQSVVTMETVLSSVSSGRVNLSDSISKVVCKQFKQVSQPNLDEAWIYSCVCFLPSCSQVRLTDTLGLLSQVLETERFALVVCLHKVILYCPYYCTNNDLSLYHSCFPHFQVNPSYQLTKRRPLVLWRRWTSSATSQLMMNRAAFAVSTYQTQRLHPWSLRVFFRYLEFCCVQ